ncbi:protein dispatched homolog 1-like isoform X1 [Amphiura filiformis]|uniref:protein dispatched homolog 1-like isoform X1 n=2 Tax=Amphiura filiformis TaxID=82378 RepID=UPI003B2132BE
MEVWGISGTVNDDDDMLLGDSDSRTTPSKGFWFRYSKLLAKYPLPVFIVLIAVTGACGATAFFAYDRPAFDDPTRGFEARGVEIINRMITGRHLPTDYRLSFNPSFPSFLGDIKDLLPHVPSDYEQSESSVSGYDSYPQGTQDTDTGVTLGRSEPLRTTRQPDIMPYRKFCLFDETYVNINRMVFIPVKGNTLFTVQGMQSMCTLQKKMLRTFATSEDRWYLNTTYNEDYNCENTWSILNAVTLINNKTSCDEITEDDILNFAHLLQDCVSFYEQGLLTCDKTKSDCSQVEVPDKCLSNDLVGNVFHYLTPKSFVNEVKDNTFKLKSTMLFLYLHWSQKWDFYMDVFEKNTVTDGVTEVAAMQFFVKFDLFRVYLESDALFVGLGTALAILIIIWYTGSLFVTVMTILNMGMSLIVSYFVYKVIFQLPFFPFVNILAIILLIGIGADDTFVFMDIWKKAKAELHGKDRTVVLQETIRHAAVTMFVTSFTTGAALYANMISSIIAIKCFAVFAGTAIMANFAFTITWLPVVVVMDDWCNEHWFGWWKMCLKQIKSSWRPLSKVSDKFATKYVPLFVFKLRYLWIVLFALLGAGGAYLIFVSPGLELPTQTDFPVFNSDHPMEQYDQVYKKEYDFEQDKVDMLPYIVAFGAIPVDDRGTWDPNQKSTKNVTLDKTFDISDPKSQQWLLDFCSEVRKQPFVNKNHDVFCFIEVVKYHMERPCSENLYSIVPDMCCNQSAFPYPKSQFKICAPIVCAEFMGCAGTSGDPFNIPYGPLYSGENNTIAAFSILATSTYKDGPDYNDMHEFWTTADTWTSSQVQKAPPGMKSGWFITFGWYQVQFYALQSGLATGAAESMGISLAIAAVVLFLTTRNFLISLYAIISVSGTVFVTIGSLVLLGWQLNITECVILSIAVGLSVDFTIHYGVAYRIAPVTDRKGRSEFALKTLGSAIMVAALSTFSAGAMMMPAQVLSYSQLGIFMMLVMSTSWVYANLFFLPLCRTMGPSRNIAQIPMPKCNSCTRGTDTVVASIDNDYVHGNNCPGDAIYTPDSENLLENVEMDTPGTLQFNSLVVAF